VSKPSRKPRKPRPLGTLKAFSEACDRPLTTVAGWTKHAAWKWGRKAPWSSAIVPDVLRWAADELEKGRPKAPTDPGTIADLRRQKLEQEIRKLRAHADQAETALARERADLHDADACEEEAVRRATLYRNAVQNIPTQVVSLALSHGMPHEAAPGFQKQIEELVNGSLRYTAASADAGPAAGDDAGA
jgi:Xaa-Pro aminopeptidase